MYTEETVVGSNNDRLALLREVISTAFEVAPMPLALRRRTVRFAWEVPDELLLTWARECRVDYDAILNGCPGLPDHLRSDIGRQVVRQHFEAHRIPSTARRLRRVVAIVLRFLRRGKLPADAQIVRESVAALGMGRCTPSGRQFLDGAAAVLDAQPEPDCLLEQYAWALDETDPQKLLDTHCALGNSHFGKWVANRLREVERWLRDTTQPSVRWEIDTLPNNGGIYQFLLKGGKKDEG